MIPSRVITDCTRPLVSSPLFDDGNLSQLDDLARLRKSFAKAKAIAISHGINSYDVLHCTENFLEYLNLVAGMVCYFADKSRDSDLARLVERIVSFDISTAFLLTEVGHGWDALNLETTATLLPDGSFDLHTPRRGAEKYMSSTLPDVGHPCFGVVMARLITDQETDRGVRTFVIQLNDGKTMCNGITARRLPGMSGIPPLGHAMTRFNHVTLPPTALLGPLETIFPSRHQFLADGWRINIGAATATAASTIHPLQIACYIVTKYSQRRKMGIPPVPIISFRTQYRPILHALSRSLVFRAFFIQLRSAGHFDVAWENRDDFAEFQVRSGYATIFKVLGMNLTRESLADLRERCGAQGLFVHNQLLDGEATFKGSMIAEGESLGLSIRLAVEVLLGRYVFPPSQNPKHPLSLHESSIIAELQSLISLSNKTEDTRSNRNKRFNDLVLPQANLLVEAIGARMAYESALLDPQMDPSVVELFSIGCIQRDLAWYVEHRVLSRQEVLAREADVLDALLPKLEELLSRTGIEPYVYAKICREDLWNEFIDGLPVVAGDELKAKL